MEVLTQTKRFFAYLGLGNENGVVVRNTHISKGTIRVFLMFIQVCFAFPEILNCVNNYAIGLHAIMISIHRLIHYVVHLTTYVIWVTKMGKFAELVDYLQQVIDKRMYRFLAFAMMISARFPWKSPFLQFPTIFGE